jgi:hypothetical protein
VSAPAGAPRTGTTARTAAELAPTSSSIASGVTVSGGTSRTRNSASPAGLSLRADQRHEVQLGGRAFTGQPDRLADRDDPHRVRGQIPRRALKGPEHLARHADPQQAVAGPDGAGRHDLAADLVGEFLVDRADRRQDEPGPLHGPLCNAAGFAEDALRSAAGPPQWVENGPSKWAGACSIRRSFLSASNRR